MIITEDTRKALALTAFGLGALMGAKALLDRRREYDLRDKTVLITGGSRGLGLVLAREVAREGARVAICARDIDELERAELDLRGRGAEVVAIRCDVTDRGQVGGLVETVLHRFGRVDVLINNAGQIQVGPLEAQTLEDFERTMAIHFWAPLYTTLAVLPEMRARGEGRIANIASLGGKISAPHMLPYCASKFALVGLSEGLRAELMKDGIAVTTVCPGLMRTGSPRNATFKGRHEAEYTWFAVGDSLPGASISAEKAAHQIVQAVKRGEAEAILSLPAAAAVAFHGIFPGVTVDVLGMLNRMLPRADGATGEARPGYEAETALTRSWITALTQKAAAANNEG